MLVYKTYFLSNAVWSSPFSSQSCETWWDVDSSSSPGLVRGSALRYGGGPALPRKVICMGRDRHMQDRADGIVWTGTGWDSVGTCSVLSIFLDFQKQIFSKISPEKWVGRSFMYAAFAWPCLACGCLGGAVSCAGSCGAHHLSCHFWCLVFAGVKMTKIGKDFHEMCLTCSNEIPSMKL